MLVRKYYFVYVSKGQIENDVYRVVWLTDRNIIPGVFSIKKLKPGVAKTVAKREGSTSRYKYLYY